MLPFFLPFIASEIQVPIQESPVQNNKNQIIFPFLPLAPRIMGRDLFGDQRALGLLDLSAGNV